MRVLIALALIASSVPALAQTPRPTAATTPAATAPAGPPKAILDSLQGKSQILGLTKQDGTRYLCRAAGGDQGLYVFQEFHFAGPPKYTTETTPSVQGNPVAHNKWVTIGSGRNRRRFQATSYSPGPITKGRRVQVAIPTTMPDDQAVRLLLAGAAGSLTAPLEVPAGRDMLSAGDVKFLQVLSPPKPHKASKPAASPATAAMTPVPATPGTAAPSASAWTMTTLWPVPSKK